MTPALTALSRSRRVSLLPLLWLIAAGCIPGFAASDAVRLFNVPADSAEESLKRFSQQAGLEVILSTAVTRNVTTRPVKGEMTGRQALEAMMAGTKLMVIQEVKTGAFTVTPRLQGHDSVANPGDESSRRANGDSHSNPGSSSALKKN